VNSHRFDKGLTLIELVVVVLIVGILAAVAVPLYTNNMLRARRAEAKTLLEQVRAAQEMWRAERGSYAINDGNGTAIAKLTSTMGVPASVSDYNWAFTVLSGTTFTARATPGTARQTPDGWLQIDHNGTKTDQNGLTYPDPRCRWSK
jgi:type IV pilus assembly protein PilE